MNDILSMKYRAKALIENITAMKTTAKRVRSSGGEVSDNFKKMLIKYKKELDSVAAELKKAEEKCQ